MMYKHLITMASVFALSIAFLATQEVQTARAEDARITVDDDVRSQSERHRYDASRSASNVRGSRTGPGPAARPARPGLRTEKEVLQDGDRTGQGPAADSGVPGGRSRHRPH
jgi:hypothetical protein